MKTEVELGKHIAQRIKLLTKQQAELAKLKQKRKKQSRDVSPECQDAYDIWQLAKTVAETDAAAAATSAAIAAAAEATYYDCESP